MIRPVRPADAPPLADGFARLSARSRRLRFPTPETALPPAELRYFTDVDHHDHEALGALNHPAGAVSVLPAMSATRTTRRPPRSRSPSSTTGRVEGPAPN
jgi:hypothetical protein